MKLKLHLLWWMNSQVYWSSPSFAIYYHCVCEPDLLFVFLLFSTRNYSDAWICKGFKCLLSREPKIKKGPEQECSLGFYFFTCTSQAIPSVSFVKRQTGWCNNMKTWKKLHGLLFWGLKQRGTHAHWPEFGLLIFHFLSWMLRISQC